MQTSKINSDELHSREAQKYISETRAAPIQKSDSAIKEHIYVAFEKDNILRTMEYYEIDVQVKNGVVALSGHIVSTSSKSLIENAVRTVPGVRKIKNALVFDDQLLPEVEFSLEKLESKYGCKLFTGVSHGVVFLNGIVGNENVKLLAEQCVAANQNARGVINNLQIIGNLLPLQEQSLLQPAIGEIIYFLDGVCGVVNQVIINPNNRRVIAMTIQGRFVDRRLEHGSLHGGEGHPPYQVLVLPMATVRYLTRVSGFLDIHSNESNRYMSFNPDDFFIPKSDWKAPYPYRRGNVLFPVELQDMENKMRHELYRHSFSVLLDGQFLGEVLATNDIPGG